MCCEYKLRMERGGNPSRLTVGSAVSGVHLAEEVTVSAVNEPPDRVKERLQVSPNERRGFIDLDPSPPAHPGLQPIVEHKGHMHQVHLNFIPSICPCVTVAAQRLAFQVANQARFFLRLSDGCVA
jgi:hypothetical protein